MAGLNQHGMYRPKTQIESSRSRCVVVTAGENLANGGTHDSSMEPIRLPSSAAQPFGTQSEWPAFGLSSGSGAPPQSPAASFARTNSNTALGERDSSSSKHHAAQLAYPAVGQGTCLAHKQHGCLL